MGVELLWLVGLIVNHVKGDPAQRRVRGWLEGDACPVLGVAELGVLSLKALALAAWRW